MDDNLLHALFASDLAQDVRTEFNERRNGGLSVADATAAIVAAFNHLLNRAEEGPVVIIAITALQLRDGALHPTFRDAAIDLLNEGHGFDRRPGEMTTARTDREQLRQDLIAALTEARVAE